VSKVSPLAYLVDNKSKMVWVAFIALARFSPVAYGKL